MAMTSSKQSPLTSRTHARLAAYTTLAGATLAATAATTPDAKATVIYSGPVNISAPITTAGVYLNVVTGVSDASPTNVPGWDLNLWGTSTLFAYGQGTGNGALDNLTGGSSTTLVDNLPSGTSISGTSAFGNVAVETTGTTAFNLNSSSNYIGFRFTNEVTGAINYGWAQVSLGTAYNVLPRNIIGYAYENSGAAIAAGAVPEPSTTALLGALATGAVGVRQWRRRKTA